MIRSIKIPSALLLLLVLLVTLLSTNAFQVSIPSRALPLSAAAAAATTKHAHCRTPHGSKFPHSWCPSALGTLSGFTKRQTRYHLVRMSSSSNSNSDDNKPFSTGDALLNTSGLALRRFSWISWWTQVILTTISSVTLIFAKSVVQASASNLRGRPFGADGFFLAGTGIVTSFVSIFWTWGGARLARRLTRKRTSRVAAANMLRRAISVGVTLNLIGMLFTLLGAQQIVGGLAIKVLSMQGGSLMGGGGAGAVATIQPLQPLDILVVQANTNTLLSQFCSLACSLYLTKFVKQLDPPSIEGDQRN